MNAVAAMSSDALSGVEQDRLADAEQVIERGLRTFVEVGQALGGIRDNRLYRATHDTFEAYCEQRWNLSRSLAYDTIAAAESVTQMSAMADTPVPTNVRQARELRGLDPEPAAQAMRDAHEATGGKPTAKAIREAVVSLAERQSAGYVERYPDLAYYADRGRHVDVVRLGSNLDDFDADALPVHLDALRKTVAFHEREERGEPHPPAHSTINSRGEIVPITSGSAGPPEPAPAPDPSAAAQARAREDEVQRDRGRKAAVLQISESVYFLANDPGAFIKHKLPHEHRFVAEPMRLSHKRIDEAIHFLTVVREAIAR